MQILVLLDRKEVVWQVGLPKVLLLEQECKDFDQGRELENHCGLVE